MRFLSIQEKEKKQAIRDLLEEGAVSEADIIWQGPDGSLGIGEPALEDEESGDIDEMVAAGTVRDWVD